MECKAECEHDVFLCSERPALLFEVRCADHGVSLGGAPWRYIISSYNNHEQFHVYLLETKTLVRDRLLTVECTVIPIVLSALQMSI